MGTIKKIKTPLRWPNGLLRGEKAFILHGWTYSTEKYKKIAELLTNHGVQTEILKVPGLTEKTDKSWTIDDYVEWLRQKIENQRLNNLAMKQFNNKLILIGHSNGGRIAATYASIYPTKLDRLILIDCAGIPHNELHAKLRLFFFSTLAKLGKKVSSSALFRNLMYKMTGESDYNNATHLMKKTMTNLIKTDLSFTLAKITTPTLIVWGEYDKVTPLNDGKIMHKLIKNSKLYVVKGAKHSPHFTHAREVVDAILKTLNI